MLFRPILLFLTLLVESSRAAAVAHRYHDVSLPSSTAPPEPGNTDTTIEIPKPTTAPDWRVLKRQSPIPSGAVEVVGLPGAVCPLRSGTDVRSTSTSEPTGLMWLPYVPFSEGYQTVYFGTDTDGIVFENVHFSNPASNLDDYTTLLQAYSNSSGWSMVMPTTIPDTSGYQPHA